MEGDNVKSTAPRWTLMLLALLWIWMSFAFLGLRPWSSRGEPREALVAQSMMTTGNFVLGEGYGGIVPSKPPVLHWSAAAFGAVNQQITEWGMRAPSALAGLILALLVFVLSRKLFPSGQPLLAALILITSFEFFRSGIEARVDMVLCASMFGALLALYSFVNRPRVLNGALASALIAVAVLAKGPVGVVLPVGAVGAFLWFDRRTFLKPVWMLIPVGIGCALAGIWYYEALLVGGTEFFERVKYENVLRFLGTQEDQPHKHSALYLVLMLLVGMLPWTVAIGGRLFSSACSGTTQSWFTPRLWGRSIATWYRSLPEQARLLAVWCIVVLVFFCIPGSKRGVYLLPMYPAVAVLAAHLLGTVSVKGLSRVLGSLLLVIGAFGASLELGLLTKLGVFSGKAASAVVDLSRIASESPAIWIAHLMLLICGAALLLRANRLSVVQFGVLFGLGLGGVHGGVLPLGAQWLSPRKFAQDLGANPDFSPAADPSVRLLSYGHEFYGLSFYLKQRISRLEETELNPGEFVFVHEDHREELLQRYGRDFEFVALSMQGIDEPFNRVFALRYSPRVETVPEFGAQG